MAAEAKSGRRKLARALASLWPDAGSAAAEVGTSLGTYRAEADQLRRARAPTVYALFIGLAGITALLELAYFPSRRVPTLVAYGGFSLICAGTGALLRRHPLSTRRLIIASNNALVLCLLAYYVAVRGDAEVCALTLLLLMTGFVLLDLSDARTQAASCIGAVLGFPVTLHAGAVSHIPETYNVAAVLSGALVTTLGALLLDRQRTAAAHQRELIRDSEDRYRRLYEDNPVMYFTVDASGNVLSVNRFGAEQLGYTALELIGLPVARVIFPADRDEVRTQLERCLAQLNETAHFEFRKVRQDGSAFWVRETARAVRSSDGQPVVLIVCEDITARKRAEEVAHQHRAELAHVARVSTMGEMAAGLAHEINQPLAAIVNYTRGAQRRLRAGTMETPALHDALEQISALGLRAGEIIRRMREFVRKEPPTYAWVDLNALVRNVGALTEPDACQHAVDITYDLALDMPTVCADRIQIEQVVLNLMRNAIEAMETIDAGEKILTVTTRAPAPDAVEVAISDTGVGLTTAQLERAFEPFFTTKMTGLGLGLGISRSIVEGHGGRLWATPHTPRGTTFRFRLARNAVELSSSPPADGRGGAGESERRPVTMGRRPQ